jgi:hypothetical protein
VAEVAEKEMWDEEPVREQLILENQAYEEGRLDEEAFRAHEGELLARLREIREHRREMAREMARAEPGEQSGPAVDERRRVVIELPDEVK